MGCIFLIGVLFGGAKMPQLSTLNSGQAHIMCEERGLVYEDLTDDELARLKAKVPAIPKAEDVVKMTIELERDATRSRESVVFVVPQKFYKEVLEALGTPELNRDPRLGIAEVASVKMYLRSGAPSLMRVSVFQTFKSRPIYSVNGIMCWRSGPNDEKFDRSIQLVSFLQEMEAKANQP